MKKDSLGDRESMHGFYRRHATVVQRRWKTGAYGGEKLQADLLSQYQTSWMKMRSLP
jgi:hypothetical protein